jgi:hypothetical protein
MVVNNFKLSLYPIRSSQQSIAGDLPQSSGEYFASVECTSPWFGKRSAPPTAARRNEEDNGERNPNQYIEPRVIALHAGIPRRSEIVPVI